MNLEKVITIIGTSLGIVFTYWFFLMKKEREIAVTDSVDIIVDGGYNPSVIAIPVGRKTILNFIRKDSNSCLEEVVLGDFKVRKYLPLNQSIKVELNPKIKGEFGYSCGMNMFHGKIIVKDPEQTRRNK